MQENRQQVRRSEDRDQANRLETAVSVMLEAQANATSLLSAQHNILKEHIIDEQQTYEQGQKEVVSRVDKLERKLEDNADKLQRSINDAVKLIELGVEKAMNFTKQRTEEFHDHSNPEDIRKNDVWTTRQRQKEERQESAIIENKVSASWEIVKYILIGIISLVVGVFMTKIGTDVVQPAIDKHDVEAAKKFENLNKELQELKEIMKDFRPNTQRTTPSE